MTIHGAWPESHGRDSSGWGGRKLSKWFHIMGMEQSSLDVGSSGT